jgi:hypothetical protein
MAPCCGALGRNLRQSTVAAIVLGLGTGCTADRAWHDSRDAWLAWWAGGPSRPLVALWTHIARQTVLAMLAVGARRAWRPGNALRPLRPESRRVLGRMLRGLGFLIVVKASWRGRPRRERLPVAHGGEGVARAHINGRRRAALPMVRAAVWRAFLIYSLGRGCVCGLDASVTAKPSFVWRRICL